MIPSRERLCPYLHTSWQKTIGPWVRGTMETAELVIIEPRGLRQVKFRCTNCRNLTGALPQWLVLELMGELQPTVTRESMSTYPDCSHQNCTEPGVEWHHYAPRNTFGADADDWSVMPLCRSHHVEWHQRMDGYRWRKKAVS